VGVKYTIDEQYLSTGDNLKPFNVTATNYKGDINKTGVKISITLPKGLTCLSNNTGKGNYNHNTGIWSINNLAIGESVTLTINAWGLLKDMAGIAEIVSSTFPDPNLANNKACLTRI